MSPHNRALIVVDVQQEYFNGPLEVQYPPRQESLARIVRAVDVASEAGMPIAVVQHDLPEGAPVFANGSAGWSLHADLESRLQPQWKRVTKSYASVMEGTGLTDWLREQGVDRVTLVGYMTNNCILGTAVTAEPLGIAVEVLSDATGAIHISNSAGSVPAKQVHETLMAVLNSNFAAVATTAAWAEAVSTGTDLTGSDLGSSAMQGRAEY